MENFRKATKRWHRYIASSHHKDNDCHWYLSRERVYSYGEDGGAIQWVMRHEGYITQFYTSGATWQIVVKRTIEFIDNYIAEHG